MSKFKIKKRSKGESESFDINVTPMLDMFSVLIAFLLMTAVFSSTGQQRVEIPFLSSKPPPTQQEQDKNPERMVTAIVDNDVVRLEMGWTNSSKGLTKEEFRIDPAGLDKLQEKLYQLRTEDKKFDKVTIMTELDVKYETLVSVIDTMRELKPGRQPIPWPPEHKLPPGIDAEALIPKIVLGNVIM